MYFSDNAKSVLRKFSLFQVNDYEMHWNIVMHTYIYVMDSQFRPYITNVSFWWCKNGFMQIFVVSS